MKASVVNSSRSALSAHPTLLRLRHRHELVESPPNVLGRLFSIDLGETVRFGERHLLLDGLERWREDSQMAA